MGSSALERLVKMKKIDFWAISLVKRLIVFCFIADCFIREEEIGVLQAKMHAEFGVFG